MTIVHGPGQRAIPLLPCNAWTFTSAWSARRRLTEQIYRHVRAAIRAGQLRPDDGLPSSRDLASRLTVPRNTVIAAYDRLSAEGMINASQEVGAYFVDRHAAPGLESR